MSFGKKPEILLKIQAVSQNLWGYFLPRPISQPLEVKAIVRLWLRWWSADLRDVKNEECSSEFIENKGAEKVLLRSR
jgi:hypothetical protein